MRFDLAALERFFGLGALSATKQHRLNVNRSWSAERYVAGKGPALERYQVVERRALYGQQHRLNVIRSWSAERYVAGEGPALERYQVVERGAPYRPQIQGQRQSAISPWIAMKSATHRQKKLIALSAQSLKKIKHKK